MPELPTSSRFNWNPQHSLRANLQYQLGQVEQGPFLRDLVQAMLILKFPEMPVVIRENLPVYADLQVIFDGCLEVGDVVIHVVPRIGEAVVRHCAEDLANGRRPLVLAVGEGVPAFRTLMGYAGLEERVEVMDAQDFLVTGVLSLAGFRVERCQPIWESVVRICCKSAPGKSALTRGNAIVDLLASLPEDFMAEGRDDQPPQEREDF